MEVDQDPPPAPAAPPPSEFQAIRQVVWGSYLNPDIFRRWSQGFVFSTHEPTALVQMEGGPCAIIAPVQAFILKNILTGTLEHNTWRSMGQDSVDRLLAQALTEILVQAATGGSGGSERSQPPHPIPNSPAAKLALIVQEQQPQLVQSSSSSSGSSAGPGTTGNNNQYCLVFLNEPLSSRASSSSEPETETHVHLTSNLTKPENEIFHRNLRVLNLENESQVRKIISEKLDAFKGHYGILQFLYSVILTKTLDELSNEMSEAQELIDPVYGHGGQSLINLMLTGRGVNYVFDNDRDVGGLNLRGISQPVEIGFLTLLERLRYCEVGAYLKNPKYPIWVLGSETHLTVLFSTNMNLVCPETPAEMARRVFHTYDPDGNNFIASVLLEDVLRALDLCSDTEYVELIKTRVDPESLGIVLLNDFMDEFFPHEKHQRPDTFTLYHYNGLRRSDRIVAYQEGNAILLETDLRSLSEDNQILTCLQTKWPSIEINWLNGLNPSIN